MEYSSTQSEIIFSTQPEIDIESIEQFRWIIVSGTVTIVKEEEG